MRKLFLVLVWLLALAPYWVAIWLFPVLMDIRHWYSVMAELVLVAGWASCVAFSLAERLQWMLLHTEQDYYLPHIIGYLGKVLVVGAIAFLISLITPSDLIVSISAGLFSAFTAQYVSRVS